MDTEQRYWQAVGEAQFERERAKDTRIAELEEALREADAAFSAYLGTLERARNGFHNSEQWYDEGPDRNSETTYEDLLEAAERRVRRALNGGIDEQDR